MIKSKVSIFLFLLLGFAASVQAQNIKGYTQEEIKDFTGKVEDQVRFLEYLLNTVGNEETPARDKDVVIRESYLKIFRDEHVQVEDDLLMDRKVVTNKDVTAYLKDIEFFFNHVNFKFKIREVKPSQKDNGEVFFIVSLDRTITATGKSGENISNTKPRFVEVNLEDKSQELKIASIYTTKLSRDEELMEWWEILDPNWKVFFREKFQISEYDSIDINQLYRFVEMDSLDISGTDSLLNLKPMEAMRQLKYVNLSNTQITELGPISNVTFLEYLDVSNTPASDIQFIKYSDRLKHLDISNTQIQHIEELANLKSLTSLKADYTPIMSFAVLNEFDSLKNLSLVQSGFNSAENIKELKHLKRLDLSRNYLINFTSLAELMDLEYLNLSETNIQDLTPLNNLENLQEVDMTGTQVSDISVLNGKEKLYKVLADQTKLSVLAADNFTRNNPTVLLIHHVRDLESWWSGLSDAWKSTLKKANPKIRTDNPNVEILTETIGVEELDMSGEGIKTLNPITRFVKLHKLNFSDNEVSDLLPLSEVKTLVEITGKNTLVRDISPIKNNELLERIDLEGAPVESIMDVLSLPELVYINVNNSAIFEEEVPEILIQKPTLNIIYRTDELMAWWEELDGTWKNLLRRQNGTPEDPNTEQLHAMTEKSSLSFESVPIGKVEALTIFSNLRSLTIFDAPLMNMSPISELKLLKSLKLSQVPVSDFSALASLTDLEELDISNTGISDLEPLSSLIHLKKLNISGTNLKTLRGLEGLINLEELDVASTNLRSLRQIEGLTNLKKLSCFNTRLNSRSVDNFKQAVPDCEVRYY
ncbi:leucine-rich repeat domain-containing protein [Algoriphagus halophilus]|uniref:leucine-rich repeat domain-containing protein n=1 Tax=Algoriphagus halophilus TaxID=226505 RepID=UPI00358E922B